MQLAFGERRQADQPRGDGVLCVRERTSCFVESGQTQCDLVGGVEICREFRHLAHHTENVQVPLPLGAGGKSWTFVITVIPDRPISFDLGVQSYQLRGLVAFVVALLNPRLNATPISHAALRCASSSPRVINEMSVRQGVLPERHDSASRESRPGPL